jgi:hypothetical protein
LKFFQIFRGYSPERLALAGQSLFIARFELATNKRV